MAQARGGGVAKAGTHGTHGSTGRSGNGGRETDRAARRFVAQFRPNAKTRRLNRERRDCSGWDSRCRWRE